MKYHQKKILDGLESKSIDLQWRLAALIYWAILLPLMLKIKIPSDRNSTKVSAIFLDDAYDEFVDKLEHYKGNHANKHHKNYVFLSYINCFNLIICALTTDHPEELLLGTNPLWPNLVMKTLSSHKIKLQTGRTLLR